MRILFLNQYGPGDPAPTARLLDELSECLRRRGHAVDFRSPGHAYRGRPAGGGSRMRREVGALLSIAWRGARSRRPDVVLTLSSPPGMLVAGALVARLHGAVLAHWAMDLYPELAVALGEIQPDSLVRRLVRGAMGWAYKRSALIVALDSDMSAHLCRCYGIQAKRLAPWPSRMTAEAALRAEQSVPGLSGNAHPWTWLYSGNLGRAHEWRTLLDAQSLLEARGLPIHLVFQGDGAARQPAEDCARRLGLRNCHWQGYVAEEALVPSLLDARVLVATQRPETLGLLWPSKLALLERLPRPILWIGPLNGAVAARLSTRGDGGAFAPGQAQEVARWMEEAYRNPPGERRAAAAPPGLEEGCATWETWLREIVPSD